MTDLLRFLWSIRDCFVCGRRGDCVHREPDVDIAIYEAEQRRLARVAAPQLAAQPWLPGFAPEELYRVQ